MITRPLPYSILIESYKEILNSVTFSFSDSIFDAILSDYEDDKLKTFEKCKYS